MRNLHVLDLNDISEDEIVTGQGVGRHFEVRRLKSWRDVQLDVSGPDPFRPDIVIVDVNFNRDRWIEQLHFEGLGDQKPIGLLLALTYVCSRLIWSMEIYSSAFGGDGSAGLLKSPWVLLPFGVLLARDKADGEARPAEVFLSSRDRAEGPGREFDQTLEQVFRDEARALIGVPSDALGPALNSYRDKIRDAVSSGRVRVNNIEAVRRGIAAIESTLETSGKSRAPISSSLGLDLCDRNYHAESIRLISLFADLVKFRGDSVDAAGVADMLEFIDSIGGKDPVYDRVMFVFDKQDEIQHSDPEFKRPKFKDVVEETYNSFLPAEERTELLRVGVLLANARASAWEGFPEDGTYTRQRVFSWLGVDQTTYERLFGRRGGAQHLSTYIGNDTSENGLQNRDLYLQWNRSTLSDQDKERVRRYISSLADPDGEALDISGCGQYLG